MNVFFLDEFYWMRKERAGEEDNWGRRTLSPAANGRRKTLALRAYSSTYLAVPSSRNSRSSSSSSSSSNSDFSALLSLDSAAWLQRFPTIQHLLKTAQVYHKRFAFFFNTA